MKTITTHWEIAAKSASDRLSGMNPPAGSVANAADDGLEQPHPLVDAREADQRQDRRHDGRESDVEEPQPPGRRADPVCELIDLRARQLGLEQLAPADAQPRQHGEREHDDPHPAEPLRELPPHQQALVDACRRSVTTDAPVVVNPDIASKNASTGRSSCGSPESR